MEQERLQVIRHAIKELKLRVRAFWTDEGNSEWSLYLGLPAVGYCELHIEGPFKQEEVEFFEVEVVERQHIGMRVPPRLVDHSFEVSQRFDAAGLRYSIHGEIARIEINPVLQDRGEL